MPDRAPFPDQLLPLAALDVEGGEGLLGGADRLAGDHLGFAQQIEFVFGLDKRERGRRAQRGQVFGGLLMLAGQTVDVVGLPCQLLLEVPEGGREGLGGRACLFELPVGRLCVAECLDVRLRQLMGLRVIANRGKPGFQLGRAGLGGAVDLVASQPLVDPGESRCPVLLPVGDGLLDACELIAKGVFALLGRPD